MFFKLLNWFLIVESDLFPWFTAFFVSLLFGFEVRSEPIYDFKIVSLMSLTEMPKTH